MIQDHPLSSSSDARKIGREALAALAAAVVYPLGWIRSRRRLPRVAAQRTVVLVHGFYGNSSSFLPLRAYLKVVGVAQVVAFDYRPRESVEAAAIRLKTFLRERVRGGRIDLVCHSMGGLVARVYLQELGGARRVDRCITLGTPHQGTYNAYWVLGRTARDLRPDSPLLARLARSRSVADRVRFTKIVGETDNIVIPRVFAGAEQADVVVVPDTGHLGLLYSPQVLRLVGERLTTGPAAPARGPAWTRRAAPRASSGRRA